jgi:hypothetical protein
MGTFNKQHKIPKEYQFSVFSDEKLRSALVTLADRYDEKIRNIIYRTYNDDRVDSIYRGIRSMGVFEQGGKTGARHRKLITFPNRYVADFVETVMTSLYGADWLKDNNALKHELVRKWWVVNKL